MFVECTVAGFPTEYISILSLVGLYQKLSCACGHSVIDTSSSVNVSPIPIDSVISILKSCSGEAFVTSK